MSKEVTVEKYIIEITRYPDGKSFQKIYPIGKQQVVRREYANKRKVEKQKKLEVIREENSYSNQGTVEI